MELSTVRDKVRDGKFFTVEFIRRSDGKPRLMLARVGVKPDGGGELNYDPVVHNLMVVYDVHKKAYRSIPVDAITYLRAHGETILDLRKERPYPTKG